MLPFKPVLKQLAAPLLFYSVAIVAIVAGNHIAPSGLCVPGLGFLLLMLLLPAICILFLMNFYRAVSKGSAHYALMTLHAVALVIYLIIMSVA